jgi:GTP diphosphokinase / guanosine-3',5'-bis(diphosphate) 3'-diphosphatase
LEQESTTITKDSLKQDLKNSLKKFNRTDISIELILKAYEFAFDKHSDQKRKSGEPYIIHPVAVAKSLLELNCDDATICAALMHDVIEDTDVNSDEMRKIFGDEITSLVDGVTKLGKLNFKSSEQEQANNFRKMLLAIAKDMRVVLVKLADRLNNMQTLDHLAPEKQQKIAQETLDIFAPLANRFGLNTIKVELEDLCLKYLHPIGYKKVNEIIKSKKSEREAQVKIVKERIKDILRQNHIEAEIHGRAKHFYSIFMKLKKGAKAVIDMDQEHEIYDLLGIRILVDDVKNCYAALGLVHENFRPMPGRFKDYIAVPKSNFYQSLHTTVVTPYGKPLEVQIRTHEMHAIAENGIAAHWKYKESDGSNKVDSQEHEELAWVKQLISWQTDVQDAEEYVDTVKKDILSQEVYILTPKGDVYTLPIGSTPVDFAYRVHSKIGDTCTGAKVNDKIVPINYKLRNGDLIEIITSKNTHPNLSWLNFVKTNQAKHKIKSWYKKQNKDRHLAVGKEMLEVEIGKDGIDQFIKSTELEDVAQKLNYKTAEDLIASIGSGDTNPAQVIAKLHGTKYGKQQKEQIPKLDKFKTRKAPVKGNEAEIPELDGLLYNIAKCCFPVPGEPVTGVISKGKGITIHRSHCNNLSQVEDDRLMELNWQTKNSKTYPANLTIEVVDRVGVIKDILTKTADAGINVVDFKVKSRPIDNVAVLKMIMHVTGNEELKDIQTSICNMTDVLKATRT